jgi:hypothetical protein
VIGVERRRRAAAAKVWRMEWRMRVPPEIGRLA